MVEGIVVDMAFPIPNHCIALRSGLERQCLFSLSNSKPYRPRPSQPGFGFLSGGLLRGGDPTAAGIAPFHPACNPFVRFKPWNPNAASEEQEWQTTVSIPRNRSLADSVRFSPF
jgi:hypothetical protein